MGKGKARLNPADAQRKKEAKRAKKRNHEEKAATKEMAAMTPAEILDELKGIARREGQGHVDPVQSNRKRLLMEMHKRVTHRVKHEQQRAAREPGPEPPAPEPAPGPPRPVFRMPPGMGPGLPPPPGIAAPPAPHAGGAAANFEQDRGLNEYQKSVARLRHAQAEEEREKHFQELLKAQLSANPVGSDQGAAATAEAQQHYAAVQLRPQKAKSSGKSKRKIIETDALGNVVSSAPKPAPEKKTPTAAPPQTKGALNLLSGYGGSGNEPAATKTKEEVDPYELFMQELSKQGV